MGLRKTSMSTCKEGKLHSRGEIRIAVWGTPGKARRLWAVRSAPEGKSRQVTRPGLKLVWAHLRSPATHCWPKNAGPGIIQMHTVQRGRVPTLKRKKLDDIQGKKKWAVESNLEMRDSKEISLLQKGAEMRLSSGPRADQRKEGGVPMTGENPTLSSES